MRDAFGGAFMIKLFLVFILIYVCFIALALNYAKAFKVKNKIIDYLETNEVILESNTPAYIKSAMEEFIDNELIKGMSYYGNVKCTNDTKEVYCSRGIRITNEVTPYTQKNVSGVYYKVQTSFGWQFKALNLLFELNGNNNSQPVMYGNWIISGETRLIVRN